MNEAEKRQFLSSPEYHEVIKNLIVQYREQDPDFAFLLEFLYQNSGKSNKNETDDGGAALVSFMNHCLTAKLSYKGKNTSLPEIKDILDRYVFDESKVEEEKQILKKTEVNSADAGAATLLFLSQLKGFKKIFKALESSKASDIEHHCGFSAQCLLDSIRTRRFLQAISQRIDTLQNQNPDSEVIHVIDAGCGAIPIMGIYAALCCDKVKVKCIEYNPVSQVMASQLVDDLGLSERIEVVCQDAEQYQPSLSQRPIDLIISETMNHGFFEERMTYIMNHLKTVAEPNTFFIPQETTLNLLFKTFPQTQKLKKHDHDDNFHDAEKVASWRYTPGSETSICFQSVSTGGVNTNGYFAITTELKLSDSIALKPGESHITLTTILPEYFVADKERTVSRVELRYESGDYANSDKFTGI